MKKQLVTIGLDEDIVDALKETINAFIVIHHAVPRIKSYNGQAYVESPTVTDKWLAPAGVVYYGYFFEPHVAKSRRSLALSNTPTYPDVRTTLAHDERAVSLALALAADSGPKLARGFIPMGETHAGGVAVVKEGNEHCGNGVRRWNFGDEDGSGILRRVPGSLEGIIEPFVEGLSQRILAMKYSTYHLKYESEDWRKNVNSKVQVANVAGFSLSDRANEIADKLKLHPVGIDFLIAKEATYLLEVNAYPGFDDVPEAKKDFIACIEEWWRGVSEDDGA